MASRGHLGGLAVAVPEAIRVLGAAGFPLVSSRPSASARSRSRWPRPPTPPSSSSTRVGRRRPGQQGRAPRDGRHLRHQQGRPARGRETRRDLEQMLDLTAPGDWRPACSRPRPPPARAWTRCGRSWPATATTSTRLGRRLAAAAPRATAAGPGAHGGCWLGPTGSSPARRAGRRARSSPPRRQGAGRPASSTPYAGGRPTRPRLGVTGCRPRWHAPGAVGYGARMARALRHASGWWPSTASTRGARGSTGPR